MKRQFFGSGITRERLVEISKDELKSIIKETTKETLSGLGVDVEDPLKMQSDFKHLREWRVTAESLRSKGWLTIITIAITSIFGLIVIGFKQMFGGGN